IERDRKGDGVWTRFAFPTWWHYDVLRGLEYLRCAGVAPDERVAEAIDLVASKRGDDGRWPREVRYPGTMPVETDEGVGRPSRWNTLRALRVMDWYAARRVRAKESRTSADTSAACGQTPDRRGSMKLFGILSSTVIATQTFTTGAALMYPRRCWPLVLVLIPLSPLTAQSADERLRALYTTEWTWRQGELAQGVGGDDVPDRFPRVDAASQQARLTYWTGVLAELDRIPFDELSPDERIHGAVFRTSVRALANDIRFKAYEAPLNSDNFFWTEFTPRQGFGTAQAYRNYISRLRDIPRYFSENMTNMRAGLARGFTVPRVSLLGRDETIEPYLRADTTSPIYTPFRNMPATIPAVEQTAMRAQAMTLVRDVVVPEYTRLLAFMRDEYIPGARTTTGASALPDGASYYKAMIEKFTTLDLT
ncbi:MAG: DUF885 domain-containing protein, partial [Longimicrobiales bacterium]